MRRFLRCCCYAAMTLGLLAQCTVDGDTIYQPDPHEPVATTAPMITVIYDADALGDRSYNDLIYKGVERAAEKHKLRVTQLSPSSSDEGKYYLKYMFERVAATKADTTRRLYIVCGTGHEAYIRQNCSVFAQNPYADLLFLETTEQLPEGCGSTLYLPYYGAMYELGALTPAIYHSAYVVASNQQDIAVSEAVKGFSDGFNHEYYELLLGMFKLERKITTQYLSDKAGEGYTIADSTAMKIIQELPLYSENITVPLCGGAGIRLRYLIDLLDEGAFVAIDNDIQSERCPLAALKHIDKAVALCIDDWLSDEEMPKHQVLGLSSGYTEVVVHTHGSETENLERYVTSDMRKQIHDDAVRKEEEAYGNK